MDRMIRVKVDGHHLTKDHRTAGVQHESNAAKMRIEFDPSWDEYAKKITFWNADGKKPVERMLTADLLENIAENTRAYRCFIPGEAMTEAGELTFIIDGYVDGKRQRSLSDTLEVEPAPYIEQADQPADPTPTQAEQLQVQIDALLGNVQANAIRAEQARLGAEQARSDAQAIIEGQIVPEISLRDKADLVNGKVPKAQLPTLNAADIGAVSKTGDTMTGILQVAMGGGNATVVADPACAYIQAFRDNSWDNRRTLLLRTKETSPDMTNALAIASAGVDAAEYTVLHTGNLQLIPPAIIGAMRIETGSYTGTGSFGSSNKNRLEFGFEPKLVIVQDTGAGSAMNWGIWIYGSKVLMASSSNFDMNATASGNVLEWYSPSSVSNQLNNKSVYNYIAFG